MTPPPAAATGDRVRLTPINSSEEKTKERIKMPNFNYKIIVIIYMVIMSVIGFVSMGIDKKRAINKKWRTPEKTLFIIAFLGGAAGSVLGMRIFKHKTKHMKFVIFMPLFLALQIAALLFICIVY